MLHGCLPPLVFVRVAMVDPSAVWTGESIRVDRRQLQAGRGVGGRCGKPCPLLQISAFARACSYAIVRGGVAQSGAPLENAPSELDVPTLGRAWDVWTARGSDYIELLIENLSEFRSKKALPILSLSEICPTSLDFEQI
jgi:hypothetical protein